MLKLLGDAVIRACHRIDEGRDGAHAVGEDNCTDKSDDDAEDALAVRDRHDVAVTHRGDGNRGPVHCGHVLCPVVGGAEVGPVCIHPIDVVVWHKEEVEKAA